MIFVQIYLRFFLALKIGLALSWLHFAQGSRESIFTPEFQDQDASNTAIIFSHIYENQLWGKNLANTPFSGPGSHDAQLVDPYVSAARFFIANTFSMPPNAVDLGCGDFNVGRQIRNVTDRYIACDIVPKVVNYNRLIYASEDVDFRILDIVTEEPPAGDVVFIRQVLQHLRNDQISRFLPKLRKYKWAIITEHIPFEDPFASNHDIEAGVYTRWEINSGVELTETPFDLVHYNRTILCELVDRYHADVTKGRIRTTAYQLQKT